MKIQHDIAPREKDLGGFSVRRLLPDTRQRMVGPWIFFDHMGPAHFAAGTGINVRPHPHINLATVTYLFEGEILHRDSLGNVQTIHPGDINLMVAGSGITHSERERETVHAIDHRLHGLQLWLALPNECEEIAPAFYHHPAADIPALTLDGVPVRVMLGTAYGVTSPVKTFSPTLYVEAHLQAGQRLTLPHAQEAALYVASGEVVVANHTVLQHHLLTMTDCGDAAITTITATREARIALLGGDPVGERFIDWNFVSSRKERIEQAKAQWRAGAFPKVPDDEIEFIPLP